MCCDLAEAQKFCRRTATHIAALCSSSSIVNSNLAKKRDDDHLRCAFVLTILALEESGKLFRVWQAAAQAEERKQDRIEIEDLFADHQAKGMLAGDLRCQMLDFVIKLQTSEPNQNGSADVADRWAEEAGAHLKGIYQDFELVRETVMYSAHDQGARWTEIAARVRGNIETENLLLWLVAGGAIAYMETGGRFSTATKALVDAQKGIQSNEAYEFTGRMLVGVGKLAAKWSQTPHP